MTLIQQLEQQILSLQERNQELEQTIVKSTIEFHKNRNSSTTHQEKILFCDFMQGWLENHKNNISDTTYIEYKSLLTNHIYPYFKQKNLYLGEITADDIQTFYTLELKKNLSSNSVIRQHSNIHTAMKYAKKKKLIIDNPMDDVTRPKASRYMAAYYNVEQIEKLIRVSKQSDIYTVILIAAFLGLRRSEIIALKWECINFTQKTITVKNKAILIKDGSKDKISKKLKTEASYRVLPLPNCVLSHLKNERGAQSEKSLSALYCKSDLDFVCLDEKGYRIKLTSVTNKFRRLIKKEQLDYIRFHDLRHSCASMLLHLGYNMKQIQEWLGHSNFATTANIYTHINSKDKVEMADKLNRAISIGE